MSPSTRDSLRSLVTALRNSGDPGSRNHPVAAMLLVTASMALLVGIAAAARSAALAGVDPLQMMFFRNFFCVVLMLPLLYRRGWSLVRTEQPRLYSFRIAVSFVAMLAYFEALALLPMAEVTAIGFLAPLLGALFAIFLLGERVGLDRWAALLAGFVGAMIMLRPTGAAFGIGQISALLWALAMGLIGPLIKQLTQSDDADRIVFITNLASVPIALVPALFVWSWPPMQVWPQLILLGVFAVLGHMTLVRGFAISDASLAMTFNFSRLPFSVLVGYLVFGELIDGWTWVGAIVIFAASALVTHREAKLARKNLSHQEQQGGNERILPPPNSPM
ncbi:MAG: DMT family transporter [Hyphomicrobium sp.]